MNLPFILQVASNIVAILLILSVLVQQRGVGLGRAFGGGGDVYRTRRGAERLIFTGTIILAIAFVLLSIASIIFAK
jgi:protein translocase SecG subunit